MGRISSAHSEGLLFHGSLNMSLNISAVCVAGCFYAHFLETENTSGYYYSFDWMSPLNKADAVLPTETVSTD